MATIIERMAPRPENNPLPQRRQEEPQRGEAPASEQNPSPQRKEGTSTTHARSRWWTEPSPQRRREESQPDNASVGGREENRAHVRSMATNAHKTQAHISITTSRKQPTRSGINASHKSGARRAHPLGN